MMWKLAGLLPLALLAASSMYQPEARGCAANGEQTPPGGCTQCALTRCNSSGPAGSTWAYPCATCSLNGDEMYCCANDCTCGDPGY
jgi:hypothetical protein